MDASSILKKYKALILLIIFTILLSLYYFPVWNYFIAGDDIYHLIRAPNNLQQASAFFTQIQQYRPIPKAFFALYSALPWSVPLFHAVSVLLFSSTLTTFVLWINKAWKIPSHIAIIGVLVVGIHHVNLYLVYTLAGVGDLLFLQFFWLSVLCYEYFLNSKQTSNSIWRNKFFLLSLLLFILTIFTKEIFLTLPVFIITRSLLFSSTKTSELVNLKALVEKFKKYSGVFTAFVIPTALFYFIKFSQYQATESAYSYHWTLNTLVTNIKHFVLWLISYQHGWQMGMPVPVGIWYEGLLSILLIFICLSTVAIVFLRPKSFLLAAVLISVSLLPFLFLQRVLVFYLDVALFGLAIIYVNALDILRLHRTQRIWLPLIIIMITMQVAVSKTVESQWLTYSFVGRSVTTAQNFKNHVIDQVDWSNTNRLCISNLQGDAAWAIDNGQMIELYTGKDIKISHSDKKINCSASDVHVVAKGDKFTISDL